MRSEWQERKYLYNTWRNMKARCLYEKHPRYPLYGARGIKISERWLESFENFFADMGKRPSKKHSIDRIDNDGDYTPDNCRWVVQKQQMNNTSKTRFISCQGRTQSITQWATELGISTTCISSRLKRDCL